MQQYMKFVEAYKMKVKENYFLKLLLANCYFFVFTECIAACISLCV